ncbi:MAG: hypothetical protein JXB08_01260 [Bacilli bacterium]|nr:hypothetical protein [Bacilli bacterium]
MYQQAKSILVLSIIILVLSLMSSLGGLLLADLYRDSQTITIIWQSNDLITLIIVVPIFLVSIISWYTKRTLKSLLVWYSALWYMIYNYAYYVYGAAFNDFYLLYLFVYTLSIGTLLLGLKRFPIVNVEKSLKASFRYKIVVAQMLFVASGLAIIYVVQSLNYVFNDQLPAIIETSGHVTSVVYSIDFSMVVLFFILGSILLLKKNPWGYVIAFLGNLKGVFYMTVLGYASLRTNPSEVFIWIMLGVLSLISFLLLWFGLRNEPHQDDSLDLK